MILALVPEQMEDLLTVWHNSLVVQLKVEGVLTLLTHSNVPIIMFETRL